MAENLELLNDEYGHCGECHEVHQVSEMVEVDGYLYCQKCANPETQKADWTVEEILKREE